MQEPSKCGRKQSDVPIKRNGRIVKKENRMKLLRKLTGKSRPSTKCRCWRMQRWNRWTASHRWRATGRKSGRPRKILRMRERSHKKSQDCPPGKSLFIPAGWVEDSDAASTMTTLPKLSCYRGHQRHQCRLSGRVKMIFVIAFSGPPVTTHWRVASTRKAIPLSGSSIWSMHRADIIWSGNRSPVMSWNPVKSACTITPRGWFPTCAFNTHHSIRRYLAGSGARWKSLRMYS